VPFFHWLPSGAQAWCFGKLPVGIYRCAPQAQVAWEWATRIRNLRRSELRELFPGATVLNERIMGLTKSFMIVDGFPRSAGSRLERCSP
jgi:hypothetical protein